VRNPKDADGRPRTRGTAALAVVSALTVLTLPWSTAGCGDSSRAVSPIVAADSDEARKARAEDQAHRDELKRKEAKALSRHKKLVLPTEPE